MSALTVFAANPPCLTNWESEANQKATRADDLAIALAPARAHRYSNRTEKCVIERQIEAPGRGSKVEEVSGLTASVEWSARLAAALW